MLNNIQKRLLLEGHDFPHVIYLGTENFLYHNETHYVLYKGIYDCLFQNPVEEKLIKSIQSLQTLNLYHMHLREFDFQTINLENIKTLNFTNNRIEYIPFLRNTFDNLEILSLQINNIKEAIDDFVDFEAPNLRFLDLRQNRIVNFDHLLTTSKFPKLKVLGIDGNPGADKYREYLKKKYQTANII